MAESGYSLESQLALDDAWISWVDEFERLRDETVLIDAPEVDKKAKPQVPAPKYPPERLKEWLEIPADGEVRSGIVAEALHQPTTRDWESVPWE